MRRCLGAAACICLIAGCVHLAGSAVFFLILSGPLGLFASPLLSLFGIPYLLPEILGVTLQWIAYQPRKGRRHFWKVLLVSVVLAGTFMGLVGIRQQGSEDLWMSAHVAAAATTAATSLVLIRAAKLLRESAHRPARPEGEASSVEASCPR